MEAPVSSVVPQQYVPKTATEKYERELETYKIRLQDINLFRPSYPRTAVAYSSAMVEPPLAAAQPSVLAPGMLTARGTADGTPLASAPTIPPDAQQPPLLQVAAEAAPPQPGQARQMSKTEWDRAYSEETFRDELVDKSVILQYAAVISLKLREKGDKLATEIAKLNKEIRNLQDKNDPTATATTTAKRNYLQRKLKNLQAQEHNYLTDVQDKAGPLSDELTKRLAQLPRPAPLAPQIGASQTGVMFAPNGSLAVNPTNRCILVKTTADEDPITVNGVKESDYRRLANSIKWRPPVSSIRRFFTPRGAKNTQADQAANNILRAMDIDPTGAKIKGLSSKNKRMLAVLLVHGKISAAQANNMIGAKSAKELNSLLGKIRGDYQTRQKAMHKLGVRLKIGEDKKDVKAQERMQGALAKHVCQFGEEIARVAFENSTFPISKTSSTFWAKFGDRVLAISSGAAGSLLGGAVTATVTFIALGGSIPVVGWIALAIVGGVLGLFLLGYGVYKFTQYLRGR